MAETIANRLRDLADEVERNGLSGVGVIITNDTFINMGTNTRGVADSDIVAGLHAAVAGAIKDLNTSSMN